MCQRAPGNAGLGSRSPRLLILLTAQHGDSVYDTERFKQRYPQRCRCLKSDILMRKLGTDNGNHEPHQIHLGPADDGAPGTKATESSGQMPGQLPGKTTFVEQHFPYVVLTARLRLSSR